MSDERDEREKAFKADFLALLKKYNADFSVSAGPFDEGEAEIDFHRESDSNGVVTRAGHSMELESIWTDSRDQC